MALAGGQPDEVAHVGALEIRFSVESAGGALELGRAGFGGSLEGGAERRAGSFGHGFAVHEDWSHRQRHRGTTTDRRQTEFPTNGRVRELSENTASSEAAPGRPAKKAPRFGYVKALV